MKKILFLAHDPGGYDVIHPIVQRFQKIGLPFDFVCIGPAALLNPLYAQDEQYLSGYLMKSLINNQLSCLVTGTSWHSSMEPEAIRIVKSFGLPTFSCIDYWSNYALRFNTKDGCFFPDYCIVIDNLAKSESIADGIPEDILYVLGHPGLDALIENRSPIVRSKRSNRNLQILFLSQPLEKVYGNQLGYTESVVLEDCIKLMHNRPEFSFKVKFHPKDEQAFMEKYEHLGIEGNLSDIVKDFDLIIGMNTMGLLQAYLCGVPIISYQPNLKTLDKCITNKLGLSVCLQSFAQLAESVEAFCKEAAMEKIERDIPKHLIWGDGKSTDRVYSFIREVIGL